LDAFKSSHWQAKQAALGYSKKEKNADLLALKSQKRDQLLHSLVLQPEPVMDIEPPVRKQPTVDFVVDPGKVARPSNLDLRVEDALEQLYSVQQDHKKHALRAVHTDMLSRTSRQQHVHPYIMTHRLATQVQSEPAPLSEEQCQLQQELLELQQERNVYCRRPEVVYPPHGNLSSAPEDEYRNYLANRAKMPLPPPLTRSVHVRDQSRISRQSEERSFETGVLQKQGTRDSSLAENTGVPLHKSLVSALSPLMSGLTEDVNAEANDTASGSVQTMRGSASPMREDVVWRRRGSQSARGAGTGFGRDSNNTRRRPSNGRNISRTSRTKEAAGHTEPNRKDSPFTRSLNLQSAGRNVRSNMSHEGSPNVQNLFNSSPVQREIDQTDLPPDLFSDAPVVANRNRKQTADHNRPRQKQQYLQEVPQSAPWGEDPDAPIPTFLYSKSNFYGPQTKPSAQNRRPLPQKRKNKSNFHATNRTDLSTPGGWKTETPDGRRYLSLRSPDGRVTHVKLRKS